MMMGDITIDAVGLGLEVVGGAIVIGCTLLSGFLAEVGCCRGEKPVILTLWRCGRAWIPFSALDYPMGVWEMFPTSYVGYLNPDPFSCLQQAGGIRLYN